MKELAQLLYNKMFEAVFVDSTLLGDEDFRKVYLLLVRIVNG